MPLPAILLVLLSAILHGVRDTFTKSSDDKQIFMWLFVMVETVIAITTVLWLNVPLPPLTQSLIFLVLIGGCIHVSYSFLLSKTLQHGDLSQVYPIVRSAPALITIIAITVFGEQVSLQALIGIGFVVFGAYLINLKDWSLKEFLKPIKSIPKDPAIQLAILTMCTVTGYSLFDKQIIRFVHPILYILIIDLLIFFTFTPYIFLHKTQKAIVSEWRKNYRSICMNGAIALGGYTCILYAFTMAKVSYVTGLRQLSIVFAVLLGNHILQEKHPEIRLTAGSIICIGSILIALAN